jgi:hypothetical protein
MKEYSEMTREELIANPPAALVRYCKKKREEREARERRAAVLATVSEKMATAAKANPESVRVSARTEDGVTIIERPWEKRPPSAMVVIEVDKNGRPVLVRSYDQETNSYGFVEFKGGYGPPTPKKPEELSEREQLRGVGARHEYNPLDALKERDDD